MIKAVIFDCYGVLTQDGWTPFREKYITGNDEVQMQIRLLGRDVDTGVRSERDMIEETARLTGASIYEVQCALSVQVVNDELLEFIENTLKPQIKIGLLSNASHDVLEDLFASKKHLFNASTISYQVGVAKPDPQIYELAARQLDAKPEECIFVDDRERFCVVAKDVGMEAVVFGDTKQCIKEINQIINIKNIAK